MRTRIEPKIGAWYESATGESFEVVAVDEDRETIEIQFYDGTVEEHDLETWYALELDGIEPPEDWSGSYDIQRDDYGVDLDAAQRPGWSNPLDELDK